MNGFLKPDFTDLIFFCIDEVQMYMYDRRFIDSLSKLAFWILITNKNFLGQYFFWHRMLYIENKLCLLGLWSLVNVCKINVLPKCIKKENRRNSTIYASI